MKNVKRVRMPSATSVVARSYPDQIIGIENRLPWHLRTDLKLFKKRTEGHAIIMGRKTFESIGKPLPNRKNIILSREILDEDNSGDLIWVNNPETALFLADVHSIILGKKQFFVIGGEKIYSIFSRFINKVFVTDVFCGNMNGDAKFEEDFREIETDGKSKWIIKDEQEYPRSEQDDHPFRVSCYMRRKPHHRYKTKEEFMGREPDIAKYFEQYELSIQDQGQQLDFLYE